VQLATHQPRDDRLRRTKHVRSLGLREVATANDLADPMRKLSLCMEFFRLGET